MIRAGDIVRNRATGEIRVCLSVSDDGRWQDKETWEPLLRIAVSSASRWELGAGWEIAWPGVGWIERSTSGPTAADRFEAEFGGSVAFF